MGFLNSKAGDALRAAATDVTNNTSDSLPLGSVSRRGFVGMMAAGAVLLPLGLAACSSSSDSSSSTSASTSTSSTDLQGQHLTFVGDSAFAPYRYIEVQQDGSQKVVGLDIAIADEMANRLGFTYDFESQEFAATLASVQSSDTSFTMAMSSNSEREQTYDFTRGYYEPRVGVLTLGGDAVTTVDDLKGKSIACTTGTVQNKFVTAVLPDADVHTYDGGDQCLQEVLAGRIDAYLCDGAEGQSMRDANPGLVLGLLDRSETSDYVGVYRVMAQKGASFVAEFDSCIGDMLSDGTIDSYIGQYVGDDFKWDGDFSASGTATEGVGSN
ncbi:MAG: ABC transporter substrate-binding protein [Coriobacteriales bacterium]|nr:ABC transporter substrate-binding protein [Coriobacteriales bacterium]